MYIGIESLLRAAAELESLQNVQTEKKKGEIA